MNNEALQILTNGCIFATIGFFGLLVLSVLCAVMLSSRLSRQEEERQDETDPKATP